MRQAVDVLVFDSGVGGLSILEAIRLELPHLTFAFVADNLEFPYGNKPASWLVGRVQDVIKAALQAVVPRVIVIACNTASTVVLPGLRSLYAQPIVGVVPAIKPAAEMSQVRCIGLLATQATVQRTYTDELVNEFAKNCTVIRVGSARLVEIAEDKMRGFPVPMTELTVICAPFKEAHPQPDVIVLGCTHFPLLTPEFTQIMPHCKWIDSGRAIAQRVAKLLGIPPLATAQDSAAGAAFFTKIDTREQLLAPTLEAFGLGPIRFLKIRDHEPI